MALQSQASLRRSRRRSLARSGLAAFAVGAVAIVWSIAGLAQSNPPTVKPVSGPWDAGKGFIFSVKPDKTRRALSGVACPKIASGRRVCLVVFDEGTEGRYVEIGDNRYTIVNEPVVLRAGAGELDAEAAATDDKFYYVLGSHSAKRGTCESNPDSRHLIRFDVDPATGKALKSADGKLSGYADSGELWPLMMKRPELAAFVGEKKCLGTEPPKDAKNLKGQRGVNLEGLAARGGRLYLGFRGPAQDGQAKILSIDADAFFKGLDASPEVFPVEVGAGRGIRDLLTVTDGILILAGPDDDEANESKGWIVMRWDGKDRPPRPLARLDLSGVKKRGCDKELKPEALAAASAAAGDIVIFSDGMCDGGPLRFQIGP